MNATQLIGGVAQAASETSRLRDEAVGVVSAERIAETARSHLSAALRRGGVDADVQVSRNPRDVTEVHGSASLQVRDPGEAVRSPLGQSRVLTVWVDVFDVRGLVQSVPVALEVLSRNVTSGNPRAQVEQVPVQVARVAPEPPLRGGPTARPAATAARLAVRRGDLLPLRAVDGPLRVEGHARALEDGTVGQQILARLRGASEPIRVMVTAEGNLELQP